MTSECIELTNSIGEPVDLRVLQAFLADFDGDTVRLLLDAARSDLSEWSDRLIAAWSDGDAEARQRARHSLKGVCGNFGATGLLAMADGDLSSAEARQAFSGCLEATLKAIGDAAGQ